MLAKFILFTVPVIFSSAAPALHAAQTPAPAQTVTNAFFPFCIDWHDAKKRGFQEQSEMLRELGFDGVGHIWLDKLDERLKVLDAANQKLYQLTIQVDLTPGKPAYDRRLPELMPLLKGHGTQLLLLIKGMKASDPAGDEKAVPLVREIAKMAEPAGVQVLLYPHTDLWLESFQDCLLLEKKVDRPNVGVMFNLCHYLRVSKDRNYRPLLEAAGKRLFAVSINGADEWDEKPGWSRYIQPLGRGSFDVLELLGTLRKIGFSGPVGLQCYGIGGDTREHLAESMAAWRNYQNKLQ